MRRDCFAGRGRKVIPALLGFVVLSVFAIAQDLMNVLAYPAIND